MNAGRVEEAINMVEDMQSGIMKVWCCSITPGLCFTWREIMEEVVDLLDVHGHAAAGSASAVCPEDQEIPGAAASRDRGGSEGCFRSAALHGLDTAMLDGLLCGGL